VIYKIDKIMDKGFYEMIQEAFDNIYEAVCICNSKGEVIFWNKGSEKLYGVKGTDIMGKHIKDVFSNPLCLRVLEEKKPIKNIAHEPIKGKSVLMSAIPIFNDKNDIVAIITTDRDITEVVNLSEELKHEKEKSKYYENEYRRHLANEFKFSEVIGKSKKIMEVIALTQKVSASKVNIMITGESGTGKEVFARAIHEASGRTGKIIAVNCSAIPEHLFESELFGYEPGAFTGASKGGKVGKLELANNGTLFLDEIGDMPFNMQSKLLRVLQDGIISRVGSEKNVTTDFRVIAATNKNLKKAIENEEFRSDLFYRLAVVQIEIPPLRDRKEDIVEFTRYFIREVADKEGVYIEKIDEEIFRILECYEWQGNIRELKNVIHRIVVLSENGQLSKNDIPHYILEKYSENVNDVFKDETHMTENKNTYDLDGAIKGLEIKMITEAMKVSKGNKAEAAKLLNINRSTLYYKLSHYKLPFE
jgi:PAS domain S-box-containing protein